MATMVAIHKVVHLQAMEEETPMETTATMAMVEATIKEVAAVAHLTRHVETVSLKGQNNAMTIT